MVKRKSVDVDKGLGFGICIFTSLTHNPDVGPQVEQYYPMHPQCTASKALCEVASFLSLPFCTLHPALIT